MNTYCKYVGRVTFSYLRSTYRALYSLYLPMDVHSRVWTITYQQLGKKLYENSLERIITFDCSSTTDLGRRCDSALS